MLPDSSEAEAQAMVDAASAGTLGYGHIHSPYQRRLRDAVLLSVGAISGSNDADPRPAYSLVEFEADVRVRVRRVECSVDSQRDAYRAAGLEAPASLGSPGPWPVRSEADVAVRLWP